VDLISQVDIDWNLLKSVSGIACFVGVGVGVGDGVGVGVALTLGVGVGVGVGVATTLGLGVGSGVDVEEGAGAALFTTTPLFQRSFLPFFIQVNFLPW
jgi:hypothetical protein